MFVYTRGWNIDLCQNYDAIDAKIIWINEQVSVNERTSGTIERQKLAAHWHLRSKSGGGELAISGSDKLILLIRHIEVRYVFIV